jgi:nucleotide-binding universal stress UspA family protein
MIRSILVTTDGSEASLRALKIACDMARRYEARLEIFHVMLRDVSCDVLRKLIDEGTLTPEQSKALNDHEECFKAQLVSERAIQAFGQIPAPPAVIEAVGRNILTASEKIARSSNVAAVRAVLAAGEPADNILAEADRQKPDLVVMGRHGLNEHKGSFLGGVVHKVLSRLDADCLIVH